MQRTKDRRILPETVIDDFNEVPKLLEKYCKIVADSCGWRMAKLTTTIPSEKKGFIVCIFEKDG